jgi:hypothetical protein
VDVGHRPNHVKSLLSNLLFPLLSLFSCVFIFSFMLENIFSNTKFIVDQLGGDHKLPQMASFWYMCGM